MSDEFHIDEKYMHRWVPLSEGTTWQRVSLLNEQSETRSARGEKVGFEYIEVNIWKKGVALYKSGACRLIGTLRRITYINFNRIANNKYTTSEKC